MSDTLLFFTQEAVRISECSRNNKTQSLGPAFSKAGRGPGTESPSEGRSMKNLLTRNEEKKVEYLELIYDLIFVYVIGRNNSLLHQTTNGFVDGKVFLAYILCTFTIIQIWNFSIYYINMHGRNGLRDHICLFINMFLLYFIGEGTRTHWEGFLLPESVKLN